MSDSGSHANIAKYNTVKCKDSETQPLNMDLIGVADNTVRVKKSVYLSLEPWFANNDSVRVDTSFLIMPKSSKWSPIHPVQDVPCKAITTTLNGPLADPLFWKSDSVPLLLGIEVYATLLEGCVTKISDSLVSQQTSFGHTILGRAGIMLQNECELITPQKTVAVVDLKEIDKNLQRFWQFDQLEMCTTKELEHELVEQLFEQTHYRTETGRHVVKIPLKPQIRELGSSREVALKRFYMIEKKGQRDPAFWAEYVEFMREYQSMEHMIEVREQPKPNTLVYYIPHHGIRSADKFRVVFDGSCQTDKGVSLNDAQFVGPKLQRDLHEIIMRFRRNKIAISADIAKMYRQIGIDPEHWNLQRIFFREHPSQPIKEYCLIVVTYGLASSPYLSVKSMIDGTKEHATNLPKAVNAICNDFYMDDCTTGAANEEEAIKLAKEIEFILAKSCFPLRKWRSNSERLVKELAGNDEATVLFEEKGETKILGMKWLPKSDVLTYVVRSSQVDTLTKRAILSIISRLYDPNGLVEPIITKGKLLMQSLWKAKLDWDDPVSPEIAKQWESLWNTIDELSKVKIPRWLGMNESVRLQLHGFADSSGKAYGGAIYLRIEHENNVIQTHLIAAKSRVAPIKTVSIPRLELAAAHLLSQLFHAVRNAMEMTHVPYYLWTDNIAAIQWIKKDLHVLKVYVANRVRAIKEVTDSEQWNHVRSEHNPADLISRGIAPADIINNQLWWNGPSWLSLPQEQWPTPVNIERFPVAEEMAVEFKVMNIQIMQQLEISVSDKQRIPLLEYTETLAKVCRILSYVMRFYRKCKEKYKIKPKKAIELKRIRIVIERPTIDEKRSAMKALIRHTQRISYSVECAFLQEQLDNVNRSKNKNVEQISYINFPEQSKILALHPFMDSEGIVRMGNRGKHSSLPYDAKHPIIISESSRLAQLIISEAHCATGHGHVQIMTQYLRQIYWMPRLREILRSYINKCVTCVRYNKKYAQQMMADLPEDRVNQNRPFLITGVDYAGPIKLIEKYRGATTIRKGWIAIFVCMVTRAVHIDVVTEQSAMAFIMCFERFIARRGHCNKLYSDNGTNFKGAFKEIRAAFKEWHKPSVQDHLNKKGTEWKFMKPFASHQGGIYEAAVKSTKYHLKRMLGAINYTYEHMVTFLAQIEAILNSRPLYALNDDPMDMQAITPGHFLIGEPFVMPPSIAAPRKASNPIKFLRNEQQKLLADYWKVWKNEFLSTLMQRKKWIQEQEPLKIGQMVVIDDANLAPTHWLLGKVTKLIPSADGLIRAVQVRTPKGNLIRPVQKLCILPLEPCPDILKQKRHQCVAKRATIDEPICEEQNKNSIEQMHGMKLRKRNK